MKCNDISTYKYETGFWGDKCYSRRNGRWEEMKGLEATDWSCIRENYVLDFVEKIQTSRTLDSKISWDCKDIELPN